MSGALTFIYPPTVGYRYLHQRPHGLFNALADIGHRVFFFDALPPQNLPPVPRIEEVRANLFVCSHVTDLKLHQRPVLWISYPPMAFVIDRYSDALVVADCIDKPVAEFAAWADNWEYLVKRADLVFATSKDLYLMAGMRNSFTYMLPNACEFEHFSRRMESPSEMAGLKRPIIGFFGALASWIDMELIRLVALCYPEASVVLLGPKYQGNEELPTAKNIHWLGPKPYQELPAYVQQFDVALNPFRLTEMTLAVDPIKVWEMMAAGVPVVSTALPELVDREGLYIAHDTEEFVQLVGHAIHHRLEGREARLRLAQANTWHRRAERAVELVWQAMARREWLGEVLDQELESLVERLRVRQALALSEEVRGELGRVLMAKGVRL